LADKALSAATGVATGQIKDTFNAGLLILGLQPVPETEPGPV